MKSNDADDVLQGRGGGGGVGGLIPSLAALFRIGLGFRCRWVAAPLNLVVRALTPTFLLCVLCDRDPPTELGLGSPDQRAEIGPNRPLDLLVEIN